jgi:hypothetical protein
MVFGMGKKRGMVSVPVEVVLILAFIVVAGLFYKEFISGASGTVGVSACQFSVLLNSEARTTKKLPGESIGVNCPKSDLTIDNDLVKGYALGPEWGAKYEIANALSNCRKRWGGGELTPFDTGWLEGGKTFCAICYDVTFGDDFRKDTKKLSNFFRFILTNKDSTTGKYFVDDLTGTNNSWQDVSKMFGNNELPPELQNSLIDEIDTGRDYSIIYRIDRNGYWQNTLGIGTATLVSGAAGCKVGSLLSAASGVGIAIGCGVGFIGGAAGTYFFGTSEPTHTSTFKIVPTDSLREEGCTVLYQ